MRMLTSTAGELAADAGGPRVITNALIESCAIHARVLLDFFYKGPCRHEGSKDDVRAEDFFENLAPWDKAKPPKSPRLQNIPTRVGREIAHLSYLRQEVTPETKRWDLVAIAQDLKKVFDCFRRLVPEEYVPMEPLSAAWEENQPRHHLFSTSADAPDLIPRAKAL